MPIQPISQEDFNSMGPARTEMVAMIAREKAWYADSDRKIIGAVLFDKIDKDWSYVVLGPDPSGSYRCIEVDSSFDTQEKARSRLVEKMEEVLASGETVFPQD